MGQLSSASFPVFTEAVSLTYSLSHTHTHVFVHPRLGLQEAPWAAYAKAPHPPLFYALIAQDHFPLKVVALSLWPPFLPQLPSVFFISTVAG